ncbi:MAG: glycosyltransferase, partial [Gammaproteobacteria bacterium]
MQGRLPTGVDRVSLAYVQHFANHAAALIRFAGRWIVLSRADSERLFAALLTPPEGFAWWVRWLVARNLVSSRNPDDLTGCILFNTGHTGLDKANYAYRVRRYGLKPVFFVHDLIPITHPEYCRPGERQRHVNRMNNVLDLATGVVANSQATLDELVGYARNSGKDMPPAVVAWPAPGMATVPPGSRPIASPYFVMLGTIEPRKNHWLLLQLWRHLIEYMGAGAPRLVVIGQRGWECENVVDLLERCEILQGFVMEYSTCTDAELVTYLHHAQALLFPSFAEGFGMPLV